MSGELSIELMPIDHWQFTLNFFAKKMGYLKE